MTGPGSTPPTLPQETAPPAATPGVFLALEGGEGVGKSTQQALLVEELRQRAHAVVATREPGSGPLGERVRALLLDAEVTPSPRAEALLYAADRADHVARVVRPALERGDVVVTDRYVDSSLAYQGAGRELDVDDVARISAWATEGLVPHLTVVLDADPRVGLARAARRAAADRLESESLAFHQRVRDRFLALAAAEPARYAVVPVEDRGVDEVAAQVLEAALRVLPVPTATAAGAPA